MERDKSVMIIRIDWDALKHRFIATSDDTPDFITEARTYQAMEKKLRTIVPEFISIHNAFSVYSEHDNYHADYRISPPGPPDTKEKGAE